jgi:hypothetical protein
MIRIGSLRALLVLLTILSICGSAEARKRGARHQHGSDRSANLDISREADRGRNGPGRSSRTANPGEDANAQVAGGPFTAVIDGLVRACLEQSTQLQKWPFEDIARVAAPDDRQRAALDELKSAAAAAADKLAVECPKGVPAPAWTRLDAVDKAIDAADSSLAAVEPALQGLYATLDDEQKARVLLDLTPLNRQGRADERTAEQQDVRGVHGGGERAAGVNRWIGICEQLTAGLRGWPTTDMERGLRLSAPQRIRFYELVTSSLRAAEALARACPAGTALTPVRRMATLRVRLAAVRHAMAAIQPTLMAFYEGLDQEQRLKFAAMR